MGWAVQVISLVPILAALKAVEQAMRPLLDRGAVEEPAQMEQFQRLVSLMGQEEFLDLEKRYLRHP
jgi:2-methylisocitrate lyase-like PEP mutase family enzyme